MIRGIALILLLLLVSPLKAASPLLTLDSKLNIIELAPYVQTLEDKTGRLALQDLLDENLAFQSRWHAPLAAQYTLSAWWGRFEVVNQNSNQPYWYLQLEDVERQTLQAYAFAPDLGTSPKALSIIHDLRRVSYRLDLPVNQRCIIYWRLKNSTRPINFDPSLLSPEALVSNAPKDHVFYGVILGGLLILTLYNLLTFFNLKELSYLGLTIFIFSNGVVLSCHVGMINLVLSDVDINYLNTLFAMITLASSNSFFYHLMSLSERLPTFANLYRIHFWISVFFVMIIYFLPFGILYASFLGFVLLILGIPVLWILFKANVPEAKGFIGAFIVIFISCIPILLFGLGLINARVVSLNILMVGFLLFTVLLSLNQSARTRQLREQAQRVEATSKAKDAFLMTMSHELRTPMHAVVSGGTLLQQTPLNTQQHDYVEKIQTSAQHMLSLINNILDVSKINNASLDIKRHSFTLKSILENLDKLLSDQAQYKGLGFKISSDYSINNLLIGDPVGLSQVLLNLLDNAVKFTDTGSVTLIVKSVGQWLGKVELEFAVTDTGLGLSLQEQARLFEPFFQADSSVNRRYNGTGLGLTISHNLVKHLGGELQVKSKPAQGSCFFFKLIFDLAPQQPSIFTQPLVSTGSYQDKRVLLVDDDLLNQFFGKELLSSLGVKVDLAESGESSLNKLRDSSYDLVFMDVSMPDLDGYQTTQLIRQDLKLADLVIVALTAHAISGERERCLAAGMNDYLAKPFSIQELDEMLARYLLKKDS